MWLLFVGDSFHFQDEIERDWGLGLILCTASKRVSSYDLYYKPLKN